MVKAGVVVLPLKVVVVGKGAQWHVVSHASSMRPGCLRLRNRMSIACLVRFVVNITRVFLARDYVGYNR
jgi:predicted ribosome-associated RNA-binding protein Tma20